MKGLAICSEGIEDITALEIKELVNCKTFVKKGCVVFDIKKLEELCLLCYKAQSVDKILYLVDSFEFKDINEIRKKVDKINLKEWLGKKTFRVSSKIINNDLSSAELNENVGEVIFEKFKNKVNLEEPDLIFFVFINKNECYFGIDFAGFELQKRQYKILSHAVALRSTIAYALIRIADYKENEILLDAFTGSGTIPIEAALFISKFPVNCYNKEKFAFLKFIKFGFDREDKKIKKPAKPKIYGYDSYLGHITNAKKNAKIADIEKFINFSRIEVEWLDTKLKKGQIDKIVSNPPILSKNKNIKDIEKLYNEFFYQAEFILNNKGKIVLITNDMSEIIPPTESGGLKTPSTTKSGMISEHVKNHPTKGGTSKICHPPQRVVFNDSLELLKKAAEKNKFKILKQIKVMHGKEERVVVVFIKR